jgi:hypothetical protein
VFGDDEESTLTTKASRFPAGDGAVGAHRFPAHAGGTSRSCALPAIPSTVAQGLRQSPEGMR